MSVLLIPLDAYTSNIRERKINVEQKNRSPAALIAKNHTNNLTRGKTYVDVILRLHTR